MSIANGFLNLDFFQVIINNNTCLRLDFLTITLMDYLYPFFLIMMTYSTGQLYDSNFKAAVVNLVKPIRLLTMSTFYNAYFSY